MQLRLQISLLRRPCLRQSQLQNLSLQVSQFLSSLLHLQHLNPNRLKTNPTIPMPRFHQTQAARDEGAASPETTRLPETRRRAYITPACLYSMKAARAGRAVSGGFSSL